MISNTIIIPVVLVLSAHMWSGCLLTKYPEYRIVNLDALTYAGNLENLRDIEKAPNYVFEKANILQTEDLEKIFTKYKPDGIIHLAAESHVDRSIFLRLILFIPMCIGTVNLLNTAKKFWDGEL